MTNPLEQKIKPGVWIKYGFRTKTSPWWYYGVVTAINELGTGDDGDWFIDASVDFCEEPEPSVTFWANKEDFHGVIGWSLMEEKTANGRKRERFQVKYEGVFDKNKNNKRDLPDESTETCPQKTQKKPKQDSDDALVSFFKASLEDLKARIDNVIHNQKTHSQHIDTLRTRVNNISTQHDTMVAETHQMTFRSLCEKYMWDPMINLSTIQEPFQKCVYPPMLSGVRGISPWGVKAQCLNMYRWNGEKPVCKAAKLYMEEKTKICDENSGKTIEKITYKPIEDYAALWQDKSYWMMPGGARPLAYHVSITRMFRNSDFTQGMEQCHKYGFCQECIGSSKDEYIHMSSLKFCMLCAKKTTITKTEGSQDRNVSICGECNRACGSKDDLTFCLRVLHHIFPLNEVVIKNTSLDSNTPDTTIDFITVGSRQPHTILIEMDTEQHKSVAAHKEVDKKEDMAKTVWRDCPNAKILVLRFSPGGDYVNRLGEKQSQNLTTAQRLQIMRMWIIWYIATAETLHVPPFLVLYLWYDWERRKLTLVKERLGTDVIGQSYGWPLNGAWKYYGICPDEDKIVRSWPFDATGCRGEDVGEVFPSYRRFGSVKIPNSFQ
jgi:hypothetical protein